MDGELETNPNLKTGSYIPLAFISNEDRNEDSSPTPPPLFGYMYHTSTYHPHTATAAAAFDTMAKGNMCARFKIMMNGH